jgi:hypothetical protein
VCETTDFSRAADRVGLGFATRARAVTAAHAQTIRNSVDVVEPARDQIDLQDSPIVKTHPAQSFDILRRYFPGVPRQLRGVIEHGPIGVVEFCLGMVPPQRGGEFLVQRDATEELGMALDSVETAVERGDDRGDHLLLPPGQRLVGGE